MRARNRYSLSLRYVLRSVGGTTRGRRLFVANSLVAFGLVSAVVQFVGQVMPSLLPGAGLIISTSVVACLCWGVFRAAPRQRLSYEFHNPQMTVSVAVGDLFDQDADLVVGFADTFDSSIEDGRVISRSSVQGQLVLRHYGGDHRRLDKDLNGALSRITSIGRETRRSKPRGKLLRYPLGTVAVITRAHQRIFAIAYSRRGGDGTHRPGERDAPTGRA